ncbi:hypothetical protein ACKKBF_B40950 [Auxenochlorella protothecoides x Auxenochlorella symbiontica]
MTMLMICNFAVLGATLLLPSVWPGVWRRWRDAIMPPFLVSHTVALHIFLLPKRGRSGCHPSHSWHG